MAERKSKVSEQITERLPRIPMQKSGSKVVRISLEDSKKVKESIQDVAKQGAITKTLGFSINTSNNNNDINSNPPVKQNTGNKLTTKMSIIATGASESFTIPEYLDPQPKFFVSHLDEDMIVEKYDPLGESEDDEEFIEDVVTQELDEDFDYESLYADEEKNSEDDPDDFIPAEIKETTSSMRGEEDEDDKEEGDEDEEGTEYNIEETLSDCDDRSDDEIERDLVARDLYDTAIQDVSKLPTKLNEKVKEPPSITQKSLDEYFVDREEEKIQKYKDNYAGWYYTNGSEILYRRKIQSCLDSILTKERLKFKGIKDSFKTRWEIGQTKQMIVDQALIKFDSYYKETLGKRNRAVQQTAYEMNQKILKLHEINRYNKELQCLLRLQEEGEKRLERFRIFERYLEKVRDESHGEFSDIRDIIDRYGILSQARSGLITRDLKNQDKIERAQNSLKRTMDLRSNELLVYNNYLSELRVYRDDLQEEILKLEEMLLHIKQTAASRTLVIGQIKLAINNLYLGLCKQLGRAGKIPPEDTLRQLNYIKTSMKEIVKLSKDVKQILKIASYQAEKDKREKARLETEGRRRKFRKAQTNKLNDFRSLFGFPDDN